MSFFQLLANADFVIKLVIMIMIILSILIWAVLFEKIYRFKEITMRADIFEKKFWSGIMLEEFYEKNKSKLKHPMGQIFSSAMQEWVASDTNKSVAAIELIKAGLRERMMIGIDATITKIEISINKYMGFLNVVAAISPFIGLFGTVWGIMSSFRSIADAGNASLTAVAPGVAEALITTAIGILIAICATGLHAYLRYKINNLLEKMYSFGSEILNILSRELDAFSVKNYNAYNNITE